MLRYVGERALDHRAQFRGLDAARAVVQLDALDLAGAHEWDAGSGITRVR
jgi:hypothetical protein